MNAMTAPVLLLNSSYEPLNVINVKRALRLLVTGKANSLERDAEYSIRTHNSSIFVPIVVKLAYYVRRPMQRVKFTKRSVLLRDEFKCQYCSEKARDLTLDHVVPKTKGGVTSWTNIVACCKSCNSAKGGQSLKDSGMQLAKIPREPRFLPYLRMVRSERHSAWDRYLFTDENSQFLIRGPLPQIMQA